MASGSGLIELAFLFAPAAGQILLFGDPISSTGKIVACLTRRQAKLARKVALYGCGIAGRHLSFAPGH